ncbi:MULTISPECIES: hypothetical protein [Acinetobacter]|uniref:Uncharacterized protein n=1 Tax=Acinetobacter indicus TaxID=756892 RepID=A0A6C0XYQ0_9GAMM|nr:MULTISPECIES: hypothetical protein [Acinetobacter]MDM1272444.1 hypothetical protein [Acinetobacter indicus]QFS18502.1 hypothetical protein FHP22_14035 [Acinetobacter indicus]QIC69086.1 hypothetical protein FSC09_00900 [Acinetobacter indicus]QIC72395.1 hypothetical protein FSC05_00900 [Acinetobacter indicus]QIZ62866.1 hypothetical protein FK538_13180 [Acinetobacter indicus]
MTRSSSPIHYLRKNFDALAITTVLAKLAWNARTPQLTEADQAVLAALRRSHAELANAPLEDIQAYLQGFDEQQIVGLVSTVKGMLHDMEFVRLDHEDGDSLYAAYLDQHDHTDFDVLLADQHSGESWQLQLKAIEGTGTGKDWIAAPPEEMLLATEEIAAQLGLESSGLSTKELTQSVEDAIDVIVTAKDPNDEHFWDYFPAISVASVSLAIYELFRRYQQQEISWSEFKWMAAKVSGIKVSKIAFIGLLLGLPVVGQVTGAYLVAKLLLNAKATWFEKESALYRKLQAYWASKQKPQP